MHIGLDFGTTHSGAALFDGRRVRLFALDPFSRDPGVMRSTMYLTREQEVFFGQQAVDEYYRQNIGRPSRMINQYVGEIEMTVGDVGSVKGYPVEMSTFVRDVYVKIDALTPGRLLRSLKSGLATGYEGTKIFDRYYALEDLLSLFLGEIRRRVERESGEQVDGVVLGRPVHFVGSSNPAGSSEPDDQLAVERLAHAAQKAGFPNVDFELEPVAAALHYALTLREPQNVLVFDLGGGTLDLTVIRLEPDCIHHVLATGGLGIAGDIFEQRIIEGMLLDHLGRGSTWGDPPTPFPAQYTEALVNWQTIPELNRPETLHFLQLARLTGSHPKQIQALRSLIVNNYALKMVDEVERAKIALSDTFFTAIQLAGEDIDIWQPLARSQFEALIAGETAQVEACLQETLARSGLSAAEIDAVVRTGGSAQIPRFVHMLERTFGADKVVAADAFSSVTAGLAVRAHIGPG